MKGLKYSILCILLSFACFACACDSSDSPMPSNLSQGTEEGVENGGEEFKMLLDATIKKKEKRLNGLKTGGYDVSDTESEINQLKKLIKGE